MASKEAGKPTSNERKHKKHRPATRMVSQGYYLRGSEAREGEIRSPEKRSKREMKKRMAVEIINSY